MFNAPITTPPHSTTAHCEAVQKVFKSTTSASPPFEGSPRAGAAEYVLRGDVNNQLVTKYSVH